MFNDVKKTQISVDLHSLHQQQTSRPVTSNTFEKYVYSELEYTFLLQSFYI
jgi:hypothetical protein